MRFLSALIALLVFPLMAYADGVFSKIDLSWTFMPTLIIFLLTLPFMMLFHGRKEIKANSSTTLLSCFVVSSLSSFLWFMVFLVISVVKIYFF